MENGKNRRDDMMTRFGKMILRTGLAAMALGMAGSAQAAQFLITYKGIVSSGGDDGVFGSVRNLAGLAFTAVYTLNDPSPDALLHFNNGVTDFREGGPRFGGTSPMVSASLTIDGTTRDMGAAWYSQAALLNSNSVGDGALHSFDGITQPFLSETRYSSLEILVGNVLFPLQSNAHFLNSLSYADPVVYNVQDGVTARGGLFIRTVIGSRLTINAIGVLRVTSFSIGPAPSVNAVPEPANWALMITGFGLVGGALRSGNGRRRHRVRVTYA
jgi:hypothetical protein